jgi:YD repeat-containing protein
MCSSNADANGYLISIEGPLPGASTTFICDSFGRVRTKRDDCGHTLTFEYDAFDRLTRIFDRFTYTRLNLTEMQNRAGRKTTFEHDSSSIEASQTIRAAQSIYQVPGRARP